MRTSIIRTYPGPRPPVLGGLKCSTADGLCGDGSGAGGGIAGAAIGWQQAAATTRRAEQDGSVSGACATAPSFSS